MKTFFKIVCPVYIDVKELYENIIDDIRFHQYLIEGSPDVTIEDILILEKIKPPKFETFEINFELFCSEYFDDDDAVKVLTLLKLIDEREGLPPYICYHEIIEYLDMEDMIEYSKILKNRAVELYETRRKNAVITIENFYLKNKYSPYTNIGKTRFNKECEKLGY